MRALLLACVVLSALPSVAAADQASEPASPAAGRVDAGGFHSCAVLVGDSLRCWGFGADGQLGYANTNTIGDDEVPGSVGPVNFGAGRTVKAIAAGDSHTCALLDDATVRCWGFGGDGRLGYANTNNVSDPGSVGRVDLGSERVEAISAGAGHTCALLDGGSVRCWGFGGGGAPRDGRLGYGKRDNVGDDETPGSVGLVELGLDRRAVAISAGGAHTCAVLDDGSVRCWGEGGAGQLGYGNRDYIGDNETPDTVEPVKLGRKAKAISAGDAHTCAVLDDGSVRCWGLAASGRLGYGNQDNVGDNETPDSVGLVDLGARRTAVALSAGKSHSCARLDDGSVRCWGYGVGGRLGYCNQKIIGDDELPGAAGPVDLGEPGGGAACPALPGGGSPGAGPARGAVPSTAGKKVGSDVARARVLRSCLAKVASHAKRERRLARRGSASQRAHARRHLSRHAASGRRRCFHLYGRTPGRIRALRARPLSGSQIELAFNAPGTEGDHPPAAHSYLIRQSRRPIRNARDFTRADTLCQGSCRFNVTKVGAMVSLTVTGLRPRTTYYYALAARDNVSGRCGPRSKTVKVRTADKGPPGRGGGGGHGHGDPGPPRIPNRRAGSCRALR